jgi:hypothetical protein
MNEVGGRAEGGDAQLRFLLATGRQGFPSRSDSVARLHLVKIGITARWRSSLGREWQREMWRLLRSERMSFENSRSGPNDQRRQPVSLAGDLQGCSKVYGRLTINE